MDLIGVIFYWCKEHPWIALIIAIVLAIDVLMVVQSTLDTLLNIKKSFKDLVNFNQ